jgi:aerobic carbon-monoxide dehydrogenase medium subunit
MYPTPFEYHRVSTIAEAVSLLGQYGEDGKLIAGGHSLLPVMKLRFAQPKHLIDIRRVPELTGIREDRGAIVIGAATTHRTIASSPIVQEKLPMLSEAASHIGDPQVRSMGTIGGSLAHADPNADFPAVVLALGGEIMVAGPGATRSIAADQFFAGSFATSLGESEVITGIRLPIPGSGAGTAYEKHPDPASGYAIVGVAAHVTVGDGGIITAARVAMTGLPSVATRLTAVEAALTGQPATAATLDEAAKNAAEGLDLSDDRTSSAAYKANLATIFARRAIARATERASG